MPTGINWRYHRAKLSKFSIVFCMAPGETDRTLPNQTGLISIHENLGHLLQCNRQLR